MQSNTERTAFDRLAAHGAQRPTSAADIARQAILTERDRRTERRLDYALWVVAFLTSAWLFMLAVGVARHRWLPDLPTIDYGTTLLLQGMIASAVSGYTSARTLIRNRGGRS